MWWKSSHPMQIRIFLPSIKPWKKERFDEPEKSISTLLISLGLLLTAALSAQDREDTLYYEVNARLLVKDRQQAADALTDWAEKQNGYFVYKTQEQISLRLP